MDSGTRRTGRREEEAGLEPDECYRIGEEKDVPDLAVEVVKTSGGIRFQVFRLTENSYRRVKRSIAVRGIDLGEIARLVRATDRSKQTHAVKKAYRRALRRRAK